MVLAVLATIVVVASFLYYRISTVQHQSNPQPLNINNLPPGSYTPVAQPPSPLAEQNTPNAAEGNCATAYTAWEHQDAGSGGAGNTDKGLGAHFNPNTNACFIEELYTRVDGMQMYDVFDAYEANQNPVPKLLEFDIETQEEIKLGVPAESLFQNGNQINTSNPEGDYDQLKATLFAGSYTPAQQPQAQSTALTMKQRCSSDGQRYFQNTVKSVNGSPEAIAETNRQIGDPRYEMKSVNYTNEEYAYDPSLNTCLIYYLDQTVFDDNSVANSMYIKDIYSNKVVDEYDEVSGKRVCCIGEVTESDFLNKKAELMGQ